MSNWSHVVDRVTPFIVRIETPSGQGTGFLCLHNHDKTFSGIATALHVVKHADEWQQPIKITRPDSGQQHFIDVSNRFIFTDARTDSAVILIPRDFEFPEDVIPLFPPDATLPVGTEVGWLGYPWIADGTLCFFSGCISARHAYRSAYLIDGVSVHGVSGGPVMYVSEANGVQIIGTVNAYSANRTGGETLPGLLIAQDVSHFHKVTNDIKNLDEANKRQQELFPVDEEQFG